MEITGSAEISYLTLINQEYSICQPFSRRILGKRSFCAESVTVAIHLSKYHTLALALALVLVLVLVPYITMSSQTIRYMQI
jgi:hypothetical protein